VKNTTSVDYCIQLDKASFSADEATVHAVVKEAFDYWKRELLQPLPSPSVGYAQVATQTFNEVATCAAGTPLRFVFGWGNLTGEESKWLDDHGHFIAVSVLQAYDLEQLKGQGFVYISADIGPHSYMSFPDSGHLFPQAWQQRKLLQYAVMHELGHVFGIPHMGTGLMSEVFLDQLIHNSFYKYYVDEPLQTFITPPLEFEVCTLNGTFNATFFQIPADTSCVRLSGKMVGGDYQWDIYARKAGPTTTGVLAGSIHASPLSQLLMGAKPAVLIQLPPEQKVFSLQERFVNTYMVGPIFTEGTARGVFQTVSSPRPNDVQVEVRADSIVMSGIVSGHIEQVLVYRPLLNGVMGPLGP